MLALFSILRTSFALRKIKAVFYFLTRSTASRLLAEYIPQGGAVLHLFFTQALLLVLRSGKAVPC